MVTGATDGPTYRAGILLDILLQPVVGDYCKGEVLKDTTEFLQRLESDKSELEKSCTLLGALDVTALYPSIRQDLLIIALDHALTSLGYSENRKMMITELTKFCSQNSTV